jgi:N-acetylmuramic acid 6-phosphate (MurNAc-6-P) etherase
MLVAGTDQQRATAALEKAEGYVRTALAALNS